MFDKNNSAQKNIKLYDLLEEKYRQYNVLSFIENDPISIPHRFTKKEDIEISGFLTSIISWGQRATIIRNGERIMQMMDFSPYNYVMNHTREDLKPFKKFVHRTFNGDDCIYFIKSLREIYSKHGGLENSLTQNKLYHKETSTYSEEKQTQKGEISVDLRQSMISFHKTFFMTKTKPRTTRHLSNPEKNSASKRLNMFLRWMVRTDGKGVDFGIWEKINSSQLYCPLDVHSGNVARKLGLLKRASNDWKAVEELTECLKQFDSNDPVKYDFALFGLGINERIK